MQRKQAVAAQDLGIGRVVIALARRPYVAAERPRRGQLPVRIERPGVPRAMRQQGAVGQVLRNHGIERGSHRDRAQVRLVFERAAADARLRHVDRQYAVEDDQVAEMVLVQREPQLLLRRLPAQVQLLAATMLGMQERIAEAGVVQVVEAGRDEARPARCPEAPLRREVKAVGQGAGHLVAELGVFVAAQVSLPVMRTGMAIEPQLHARDGAVVDRKNDGIARNALAQLLHRDQHGAHRRHHVVLPAQGPLVQRKIAEVGAVDRHIDVRIVARSPIAQGR